MKRQLIIFALFLLLLLDSSKLYSSPGDTVTIQTFTFTDISKRRSTFQFPNGNERWQKIYMVRTLKCDVQTTHDQYPCGEWDYLTYTLVYVPIPNDTAKEVFELDNFISPYGKRLSLNGDRGWQFIYDVTDYAPLLHGSVDILSGNQQELLDMKFIFIKGIPPRDVIGIENIYPWGKYNYSKLADNEILQPRNIILRNDAKGYKLKARISGHGEHGPYNCCEWDGKQHRYTWGNNEGREVLGSWLVWKDCGRNPIFPQGGTWTFDRAGWCPGSSVQTFEFDISDKFNPGDTITNFDYEIQPYTNNGEKDGEFNESHQIVYYSAPNFKNDASIVDIVAPSDYDGYSRDNPICGSPRILIQNTGTNLLQSVKITYGLTGGKKAVYVWHGQLKFLETQEVYLPIPSWAGVETNPEFIAEVNEPNNTTDEYSGNNSMRTHVKLPRIMPNKFKIHIEANDLGRAKEDAYTVTDANGKIYYSLPELEDNKIYDEIIELKTGCYTFLLTDKMEDGMNKHWWEIAVHPELVGKNGRIAIMTLDNRVLQELPYDFGQELRFCFRIGSYY